MNHSKITLGLISASRTDKIPEKVNGWINDTGISPKNFEMSNLKNENQNNLHMMVKVKPFIKYTVIQYVSMQSVEDLVFGSLGSNSLFFTHSSHHGNVESFTIIKSFLDFFTHVVVRYFQVFFHISSILIHQGQKSVVVNIDELVIFTGNIGDIHVVSRGTDIFIFLVCENVNANHMNLSVTVFSSLRS